MKIYVVLILCSLFAVSCKTTTETLIVGSSKVPCTGNLLQDCFQIRKDSTSDWVDFTGSIEGFDYDPGYSYTLEVEKATASNDGINSKYALKKILKKVKMLDTEKEISGNFIINTFKGAVVDDKNMAMNFNAKLGQINGKGVCNRFSGTFTTSNSKIKFSQAATTKMLCREPELERDFFQALNQVDHFSLKEDELLLMKGNETVLTASLKTEE